MLCNPTHRLPERLESIRDRVHNLRMLPASLVVLGVVGLINGGRGDAAESEFAGLIRTKAPDRSSYRAPTIAAPVSTRRQDAEHPEEIDSEEYAEDMLVPLVFEEPIIVRQQAHQVPGQQRQPSQQNHLPSRISNAAFQPSIVHEEHAPMGQIGQSFGETCGSEPACGLEPGCGCEEMGYGCDGSCMSCDSGCDSLGLGAGGCGSRGCGQADCGDCCVRLSMDPCQWFGAVELLLMWRVGDGLPELATTSDTPPGGSGVLGADGTRLLFGGERVMDELTAGGRFTIGTWLDNQQCQSLVFRAWGAEQDNYRFATDQTENAIIARPFFNVDPALTPPAQGSQVIASPVLSREGSINIDGSNEVYGADISLRQRWLGGLGGFVDVLYGYQYMRMDDNLRIGSSTFDTSTGPTQGVLLNVLDRFEAENEFHGGQLGLAARYREGCWSFNGTIKAAAGSLRRSATRVGSQTRTVDGNTVAESNGLLVRSTNAGETENHTFGWVPELDATLGWRWTRNLDVTIGYHAIGMTEALQVSGMIDRDLAVNASAIPNGATQPLGQQRPDREVRYDTFYIHGIHFGVQCVY